VSNTTLDLIQKDVSNFMQAIAAVKPAQIATDPDSNMENHARCRTHIVSNFPAIQLPAPVIHSDYYKLALLALAQSNGLVLTALPEPGYKMGVLFSDNEDEEKSEPAPLPPSPNDPFQRQDAREAQHRIDEMFYEVMGRTLSPAERLVESKRVELGKPEQFNEYEEVGRTINGRFYVDHGRTAEKRAENRRKNEALRKKK
jgi:hypothetical protein